MKKCDKNYNGFLEEVLTDNESVAKILIENWNIQIYLPGHSHYHIFQILKCYHRINLHFGSKKDWTSRKILEKSQYNPIQKQSCGIKK